MSVQTEAVPYTWPRFQTHRGRCTRGSRGTARPSTVPWVRLRNNTRDGVGPLGHRALLRVRMTGSGADFSTWIIVTVLALLCIGGPLVFNWTWHLPTPRHGFVLVVHSHHPHRDRLLPSHALRPARRSTEPRATPQQPCAAAPHHGRTAAGVALRSRNRFPDDHAA